MDFFGVFAYVLYKVKSMKGPVRAYKHDFLRRICNCARCTRFYASM